MTSYRFHNLCETETSLIRTLGSVPGVLSILERFKATVNLRGCCLTFDSVAKNHIE